MHDDPPFWKRKRLEEMSPAEWESLCDGCGRCCVHRLQDTDTGAVAATRVACRLLDTDHCRCTRYAERTRHVPECTVLTPARARRFRWLPDTCAYRCLAEGRDLAWWHPLVSGDPQSVHRAGISVRGQVISERDVHPEDLADHLWEEAR